MILTVSKNALLSAMIFQAKGDVRYYLNGVCFSPDKKLYSTDGHRAFIGEHTTDGLTEQIIVAISGPKVTKFETASIDTDTGIVSYLDENGERTSAGVCKVVDGRFPDIERVRAAHESKPVDEIGFNASYLADIEKAARLYNPQFCGVRIKPGGSTGAAIAEFSGAFGSGQVIIMPMRL
ncbi:hypothetical protein JVZ25_004920 [Escherichia coli]|nr:hypothetical protein [Escherichia coli]EHB8459473.1 hypothetical protein [Escherichia coli]